MQSTRACAPGDPPLIDVRKARPPPAQCLRRLALTKGCQWPAMLRLRSRRGYLSCLDVVTALM
eukprot:4312876-Pyramimonas_sp.AAC.1